MINDLIVYDDLTLREALAKLDSLKIKLLFVLNNTHQLIGTLTDGDVRRAIINGHGTHESIKAFMNTDPRYAYSDDSDEYKLALFNKYPIQRLGIIDQNQKLINIISKKDISTLPNIAVLMAGGLGTRLGELTKNTPKPLLKVGSKPILHNILEQFLASNIKRFKISVNYKAEMIKSYFGDGEQYEVDIDYLEETKRLGTAGCLSLIQESIENPFFVMNGDILVDIDFKDMLDFHIKNNFIATMGVASYTINIPYGVIDTDQDNNLLALLEKPVKNYYINAGVYILNPEVLSMIPKNEFYDMPTLFNELKNKNKKIGVYEKLSNWLDIGHIDDYKKAQELLDNK